MPHEALRESEGWRIAVATSGTGDGATVDEAIEEGAGGEHDGWAAEDAAILQRQPLDLATPDQELSRLTLDNLQPFDVG